jgi:hypothetical protein
MALAWGPGIKVKIYIHIFKKQTDKTHQANGDGAFCLPKKAAISNSQTKKSNQD